MKTAPRTEMSEKTTHEETESTAKQAWEMEIKEIMIEGIETTWRGLLFELSKTKARTEMLNLAAPTLVFSFL